MTSVLNVDTIAAKNGTSPVALTKQKAILVCVGFNMNSSTLYGVSNNTSFSETFNASSFSDVGTGQLETSLTNALSNNQHIIAGMMNATNNCITHESDSTASVVKTRTNDADSSSSQDNVHYFHVTGSLA